MAGHSKWANIQHRKGRQDAKRGKLFSRLIREITVASNLGGADPAGNPRLRTAIDNALSSNMSKDTINRAIRRGTGEDSAAVPDELRYEGYGPGGVALIIECISDNRKRTVAEVRHTLGKHGGNLGAEGCVAYLFRKRGLITFGADVDQDRLMETVLETSAEDMVQYDDGAEVLTGPDTLMDVRAHLLDVGLRMERADVVMQADSKVRLDTLKAVSLLQLLDALEELEDVQQVWTNADIPDEAVAALD